MSATSAAPTPSRRRGLSERARRSVSVLGVAALAAAGCVAAGTWQWHRHVERSAAVALVTSNHGADPVPAEELLAGPGDVVAADEVWRAVEVSGTYLGTPVLLRNRPVDGQPGFHVLEPLVVDEGPLTGAVVVVDRGWVRGVDGVQPGVVPAAPRGTVDVVVRLRADEPPSERDAPPGQVQAISVGQVRDAAGEPERWPAAATVRGYGAVVSEDGASPEALGPLPRPSTDLGSHLSYAFQWWVFAAGALAGAVVLLRRESRAGDEPEGAPHGRTGEAAAPTDQDARAESRAARTARSRRLSAEQEEDALLDAQEARQDADRVVGRP